MFDYAEIKAEVDAILQEMGRPLNTVRTIGGGVDPRTSKPYPSTTQLKSAYGVVVSYKDRDIDGETIRRGDRMVILQASFALEHSDLIELPDGSRWPIQNIEEVSPTGLNLVYILQVRK